VQGIKFISATHISRDPAASPSWRYFPDNFPDESTEHATYVISGIAHSGLVVWLCSSPSRQSLQA